MQAELQYTSKSAKLYLSVYQLIAMYMYRMLYSEMVAQLSYQFCNVKPSCLLHLLVEIISERINNRQEDAHEFLIGVLGHMEEYMRYNYNYITHCLFLCHVDILINCRIYSIWSYILKVKVADVIC